MFKYIAKLFCIRIIWNRAVAGLQGSRSGVDRSLEHIAFDAWNGFHSKAAYMALAAP